MQVGCGGRGRRTWLGKGSVVAYVGSVTLLCCGLTSPIATGLPVHPQVPREISGLNHACGTAVDSAGDVYVSSAGASSIEVFGPDLVSLAAISNPNTPCGLAVNGNGEVFVSESATGKVVRYKPAVPYPFTGPPSYGAAEPIDESGDAKGIAIDPHDNRLYVAEGDHVAIYEGNGNFEGNVGSGELTAATGVAVYTYVVSKGVGDEQADRHLYVADDTSDPSDEIKIFGGTVRKTASGTEFAGPTLQRTIKGVDQDGDPETPLESFGFGTAGAYLTIDQGNRNEEDKCAAVAEQACTAGHFLLHDAAHEVVDEFDGSGEFLDQIATPNIADAEPSAMSIDRSGGPNDGTIYVTTGKASGAKLLAFGPLPAPSRAPLFDLSNKLNEDEQLEKASSVAVDPDGYIYVATGALIHVLNSSGEEIKVGPEGKGIPDNFNPVDLAVDSAGALYVADRQKAEGGDETVTYYTPNATGPPVNGTTYVRHDPPLVTDASLEASPETVTVNVANDHLTVAGRNDILSRTIELDSVANGSKIIRKGVFSFRPHPVGIGICANTGNFYIGEQIRQVSVINPGWTETLARINGAGSPMGTINPNPAIAVDQPNCHVLAFANSNGAAREYDAYGGFVAEFSFPPPQDFSTELPRPYDIAVDNSAGPSQGNVYIAFDDEKANTPDLWAFGPLVYGEPPQAITGIASAVGGGSASLNGAVNPHGFDLTKCDFEYLADDTYLQNIEDEKPTFEGASVAACGETLEEIGKGHDPVPVHASLSGLDPGGRYRFRLVAENKYGASNGGAALFGPPVLTTKSALPVFYTEATLRAKADPSGLATKCHFEYLPQAQYETNLTNAEPSFTGAKLVDCAPQAELAATAAPADVQASLTGLAEDTLYRFRAILENEAKDLIGPEQTFKTRRKEAIPSCSNVEYRTGLSANLPDCRAYELVTPGETNGLSPRDQVDTSPGTGFNNWLAVPRGADAGERVDYFALGTLPGFDGNGILDGYRAQRAAGEHPQAGWASELFGPSYEEAVPRLTNPLGQQSVSPDQLYSFWKFEPAEFFPGTLAAGIYLSTPGEVADSPCNPEPLQSNFELVGCGSLGVDPKAESRYVSRGGDHVIFASRAHLEAQAPATGIAAIYDRQAGQKNANVVSLLPPADGAPTGDATYIAATEDGSAIVFKAGGSLYLRRGGVTTEVAAGPNTFAGMSADGQRVFYADAVLDTLHPQPADLFVCNVSAGPCAGPEKAQAPTPVGENSIFVNVSTDGSSAFFTSEEEFDAVPNEGGEEAEANMHNLYAWSAEAPGAPRFISQLDSRDFVSFDGDITATIGRWTTAINPSTNLGLAVSPARSTPSGEAFFFQSHAQLAAYDNEGEGEIYRYDPAAEPGERLSCVSCDPSGAPASGDAMLAVVSEGVQRTTMTGNVTDDGNEIFFESPDPLIPEDANDVQDVYEWRANGSGGCKDAAGCLALISSGKGEKDSYLYGMSADGHDVFFRTQEKLVGVDVPGSPSIYDARVEGGIPDQPPLPVCAGDACQGSGTPPPALPAPASSGSGEGNLGRAAPCRRGKHRVKGRCVKRHRQNSRHRAGHHRKAQR